jgi:putative phosphoribosyl transferase
VPFRDRADAGRQLADRLGPVTGDPVVLGLPRGGVPVAAEVAERLGAPLDVVLVRKLGVPYQPELAMGAVGEGGVRVLDEEVLALAGVDGAQLAAAEARARAEIEVRAAQLRGSRPQVPLAGRTAVVVDDGVATGSTARAACRVVRAHGAGRVVLAVPVAAPDSLARLARDADEVVCLEAPEHLLAIGQWYHDFTQTSDREVVELLERAAARLRRRTDPVRVAGDPAARVAGDPPASAAGDPVAAPDPPPWPDPEVWVRAGRAVLAGRLTVPVAAPGVVVFVHGSGSSRHSSRNRHVARVLQDAGLATLLFDLLTPEEELDRTNVFDVGLLAGRLEGVTAWLRRQPTTAHLATCYFGASTGAAAALRTAAGPGADVAAVVSRGGRPDLAGPHLAAVRAPTLLIVGGRDEVVLELNRRALAELRCEARLSVVPGATHLFEEPGTLDLAAGLARDWFLAHLPASSGT